VNILNGKNQAKVNMTKVFSLINSSKEELLMAA